MRYAKDKVDTGRSLIRFGGCAREQTYVGSHNDSTENVGDGWFVYLFLCPN